MDQRLPLAGVRILNVDDVLSIYAVITQDFAQSLDPISPAGVRDCGLLESAVYRQLTGFDGRVKYDHPLLSAASLVFGLCCDHPFYNGNKRAALVSMLVHLDRNEYALPGVSQAELYATMLAIADHRLGIRADDEVQAIYRWLRQSASRIERGERVLTYRQLRQALGQFNIEVEVVGGNRAELVRYEERPAGILRRHTERVRVKIAGIGYRDEGTDIPKSEIKKIREVCALDEQQGVDSRAFYSTGVVVDAFVCRYRRVLHRLARV
jgi:death-on-curing protein